MKFFNNWSVAILLLSNTLALAHPQPVTDIQSVATSEHVERDNGFFADVKDLWKRKGGGGGGGKGGSGSSGSSGSSGGKGGSGSSGSSSSGSTPKGSSSSNSGGQTKTGSGVTPNYGGGRYYGGGSTTPYQAGSKSPLGIAAVPLAFGAGALAFYPGIWLYGAYAYPYSHPYTFHNRTAHNNTNTTTTTTRDLHFDIEIRDIEIRQDTGLTQTKNVTCLCAMYAECGCDDNGNTTFLDSLIGDGSYANLNLSLVNVADINGSSMIVLNGTLPNGTTAAGGTENASAAMRTIVQASGFWPMIALVGMTVLLT